MKTDTHRIQTRARGRGGFTLVELLITVSIVGILTGLAIPNIRTVLLRARAADLAGDMEVVRVAALNFNAQLHTWPSESGTGSIPAGLQEFLPQGFSFTQDGYQLDYENWSVPGGLPGDPDTQRLVGVSVVVENEELGNALIELLGASIVFSVGGTHTILIDRS